jgi:hypothetical protein
MCNAQKGKLPGLVLSLSLDLFLLALVLRVSPRANAGGANDPIFLVVCSKQAHLNW